MERELKNILKKDENENRYSLSSLQIILSFLLEMSGSYDGISRGDYNIDSLLYFISTIDFDYNDFNCEIREHTKSIQSVAMMILLSDLLNLDKIRLINCMIRKNKIDIHNEIEPLSNMSILTIAFLGTINKHLRNLYNDTEKDLLFGEVEKFTSVDVMKVLLENGAHVLINQPCKNGLTVLHHCALSFEGILPDTRKDMIYLLLSYGANPLLKDNNEKTPLDLEKEEFEKVGKINKAFHGHSLVLNSIPMQDLKEYSILNKNKKGK